MEPLKINVNIEVGLKQTTLEALAVIFNLWKGCTCTCADTFPQPEPQPETKRKGETEERPEPQPTPAQAENDDLPADDAPDPKKPAPTEAEARAAVKAAKDRGVSPKVIKTYMQDNFGIASSVDCPEERRQELIDGLNKLAA